MLRTLMYSEIATIAEYDRIRVLTLSIVTDCALAIFKGHNLSFWHALDEIEPIFFQFVDDDLEEFVRNGVEAIYDTICIDSIHPSLVCAECGVRFVVNLLIYGRIGSKLSLPSSSMSYSSLEAVNDSSGSVLQSELLR